MRAHLALLVTLVLGGCGGGGDDSTSALRPDLTVPAMVANPANPPHATPFDLQVEVKNTGVVDSPISVVRLYQDNGGTWTALGDGVVPALTINQSVVLTFSLTGLASGAYAFRATVNPDGIVDEASTANNSINIVIGVLPSGPG